MQDNRSAPAAQAARPSGDEGASEGARPARGLGAGEGSQAHGGGTPPLQGEAGAASSASAPAGDHTAGAPPDHARTVTPARASAGPAPDVDAKKPPDDRFPASWRDDLAGPDKAFRKTLDRFDSPGALAKAYKELTTRLSSGDLRSTKPPPDNATPEQVAAWRAEQGLPQNAAAYVEGLQLGDGTVPGEAEKAMLASFAEEAMKGRWTADQYNQAVGWYFALQDRLAAQRDHADAAFKHEASADLMREWGHDYAVNRNAIAQFFDRSFPADFREALLTARLPDGSILANHPAFNRAILEVAKSLNPSGAVLPNASGGGLSGVESRIAEIEGKYMRAPHGSDLWKSYWTGDSGARMQQEYRGLLAAREQSRRGRAG
jgi:hypothetical protein